MESYGLTMNSVPWMEAAASCFLLFSSLSSFCEFFGQLASGHERDMIYNGKVPSLYVVSFELDRVSRIFFMS